jgi:hypothetical protein
MDLAREQLDEAAYKAAEAHGREGDVFDLLGRLEQEIKSSDTSQQVSSLN